MKTKTATPKKHVCSSPVGFWEELPTGTERLCECGQRLEYRNGFLASRWKKVPASAKPLYTKPRECDFQGW